MQQPLLTPSQPEPENKCLGCLFMKLEGIPVQLEQQDIVQPQPNSAATELINLHLTLLFNEQREQLIGGRIKFGLKGGTLKLKLENCEITQGFRKLEGLIELSTQKQRQFPPGNENQNTTKASSTENESIVKANPSNTKLQSNLVNRKNQEENGDKGEKVSSTNTTSYTNHTVTRIDKFQCSACRIITSGSEENPAWIFEVERGDTVLKGLLENVLLATVDVSVKPCHVEATFEVSPQDVCVIETEGLWPKNISRKRSVVIERAIARRFLERKLKPYLSRHKLRYD